MAHIRLDHRVTGVRPAAQWEPSPAWFDRAACEGLDPDLFFAERGESIALAREICNGCPVQAECLDYALRHRITYGVWGGLSERQRRRLRRRAP